MGAGSDLMDLPDWNMNDPSAYYPPMNNVGSQPMNVQQMNQTAVDLIEQQNVVETQTSNLLAEAMRRIQQAKLYEILINHAFFAVGSADPEIIDTVQNEIRGFIMQRLEILLGIKTEQKEKEIVHTQSEFDGEEVQALKILAAKVLKRPLPITTTPTPQINAVQMQQPQINMVQAQPVPVVNTVAQVSAPPVQVNQQPQTQPTKMPQQKMPKNTRGQTYSKKNKPLPMPSSAEMEINASQHAAAGFQAGMANMNASPAATQLLQAIANQVYTNKGE